MTTKNDAPDYFINFNPDTRQGMFGDADGWAETALVFSDLPCAKDGHSWTGDQFYILKGDFRPEYDAVLEGGGGRWSLKVEVYDKFKKQHGSRWSSDFHEWGRDGTRRRTPRKQAVAKDGR